MDSVPVTGLRHTRSRYRVFEVGLRRRRRLGFFWKNEFFLTAVETLEAKCTEVVICSR